ncbi:hypothetical protein NPIL_398941 [Nephila pilipes]|uniref:Uncharacterized protein n=1 Tax=Nephila pilipes TaxID=299642 RepID=A0A8X6QZX7_NEPPI|nr:hypothetical protein NPIL_398941 [Nephila pilipes]
MSTKIHFLQDRPLQGSNLNSTENHWEILKQRIRDGLSLPSSTQSLGEKLIQTCTTISTEIIQNHIETMPRRIRAVIQVNDDPSKYNDK